METGFRLKVLLAGHGFPRLFPIRVPATQDVTAYEFQFKLAVMWNLSAPWWEFILRGAIIYFFLLVLLRLTGKRQVGQLAPFDLVLLLILSDSVQNAMTSGDNSVLAGLILATTLVLLNHAVGYATFRSRKLEAMVEGRPQILIRNGRLFKETMEQQHISDLELKTALRNAGCERAEEVSLAILETNGHVSILKKDEANERSKA